MNSTDVFLHVIVNTRSRDHFCIQNQREDVGYTTLTLLYYIIHIITHTYSKISFKRLRFRLAVYIFHAGCGLQATGGTPLLTIFTDYIYIYIYIYIEKYIFHFS